MYNVLYKAYEIKAVLFVKGDHHPRIDHRNDDLLLPSSEDIPHMCSLLPSLNVYFLQQRRLNTTSHNRVLKYDDFLANPLPKLPEEGISFLLHSDHDVAPMGVRVNKIMFD